MHHVRKSLFFLDCAGSISIQKQLDGAADTSDEDGSDVSDDDNMDGDDDDPDNDPDDADGEGGAEEEPLNSEDDVTDEDASDLFDTDNVVVCQYDKVRTGSLIWALSREHLSGN